MSLSDTSPVKLGVGVFIGLLAMSITTTFGATSAVWNAKDAAVREIRTATEARMEERLRYYVTREDWLEWQQRESAQSNARYLQIMTTLQRLERRR